MTRIRISIAGAIAGITGMVLPAIAGASTYDLSGATDSVTAQITSSLVYILPVAGGLLALFVGWRIVKRFVH
jgi:hypothetical protein